MAPDAAEAERTLTAFAKAGIDVAAEAARTPRVGEFPFDPGRKLMTTIHQVGRGYEAYLKGSPQAVLQRCTQACWQGQVVRLEAGLGRGIARCKEALAGPARRGRGVGRLLAEKVVAEARAIGYRSMKLDTLPQMRAAIRIYETLGFVRCPAYYETPLADTVFMELRL